jgi:hypothetical protein
MLARTNRGVFEASSKTAMIERATAESTIRFSASEANVLKERELQKKCAMSLLVYKRVEHIPSFQKRMCPVTPCVPSRLD